MDRIVGRIGVEDVLGEIFAGFAWEVVRMLAIVDASLPVSGRHAGLRMSRSTEIAYGNGCCLPFEKPRHGARQSAGKATRVSRETGGRR